MKELSEVTTEALEAELGKRRTKGHKKLEDVEEGLASEGRTRHLSDTESWLRAKSEGETDTPKRCPRCGTQSPVNARHRGRRLMTLHGEVRYTRHYYRCPSCHHGFYPLDEEVGAPEEGEVSGSLSRRALDFAMHSPYAEASERFAMHYGFGLSTHAMRCMVERLPMPVFEAREDIEEQTRVTVQLDGSMVPTTKGWQESKLGVVFSESAHSKSEEGQRGTITEARYVATLAPASRFGELLGPVLPARIGFKERQAKKTGPEVVWLGDGAEWIWNLQRELCPQAIGILDWCHAAEHGAACGHDVLGGDEALCRLWQARIKHLLFDGDIDTLLKELAECALYADTLEASEALRKLQGYYKNNKKRMNYREHREAGRLIGSGVVESGHRHVFQARMKRAGQRWAPSGAEKMARLRALLRTVGPQDFYRAASQKNAA